MKGHAYLLGSHTCLRTILSAVLLAGTAAGAAVSEEMVAWADLSAMPMAAAVVALVVCADVWADDDGVVNDLFQKVNEVYDPDWA